MEEFVVYVLLSLKHNRIYVGYTSDLITRFKFHNKISKKGFTIKYRPWCVIHVEFFNSKKQAMERELSLKMGQGRKWLRESVLKTMIDTRFIQGEVAQMVRAQDS
ncbi:MAG TPA: GIY-YIG nuclease family protein [Bacteroidia bacterium]|nr:GIY-YIG nuclease family protein [Bacteroidia bacterium]